MNKTITGILSLGVVVALFLGFHAWNGAPNTRLSGGDPVEQTPVAFINGMSVGSPNNGGNTVFNGSVPFSIGVGSNQTSWQNNTGQTVYVNYVQLTQGDPLGAYVTSSSTYSYFVGTSTSATVKDALPTANTPLYGSLIDRFVVATSTNATSTSAVFSSIKDGGTNGRGVIPVLAGQYLNIVFEQRYEWNCTGTTCESATSTNRGFSKVTGFFRYSY